MLRSRALLIPWIWIAASGAQAQAPEVPFVMTRLELDLRVDYERESVGGTATLTLRNTTGRAVSQASLLVNRLMVASRVSVSGRPVPFAQDVVLFSDDSSRQVNVITVTLPHAVAPGDSASLAIVYRGVLTGYTETGSLYIKDHVSREFTIIREDAYAFPVVGVPTLTAMRSAPRGAFAFSASVTVPSDLVVAMGGTRGSRAVSDSLATWTYRSTEPVPFLNITVASYRIVEGKGFRIFALPEDSAGAISVRDAVVGAFDRFEKWYGPLGRTPDIAIMEIPEGFGSQASLSAGIILTADAFRNRAELRQLYHELSHLWNVTDTDVPSPRWNEGLATFLQWRLSAELDGWSDWNGRVQAGVQSLLRRCAQQVACATVPPADYGRGRLTDFSYTVGFLMFYSLYQVLGPDQFDRAYRRFVEQYRSRGGSTQQLVAAFNEVDPRSDVILKEWLLSTRWYARLRGGESMESILASYRTR